MIGLGTRSRRPGVLALGALAMFAAGCGSGDGDGTTMGGSASSSVTTGSSGSTSAPGSSAPREEPVAGGELTFLDSGGVPPNLDPAKSPFSRTGPGGGVGAMAMYSTYDVLLWVDYNTNEIIPRIAESAEPSEGAAKWTIKLREGVTFSDGTPYDSAAVKFNWERAKDPALASRCRSTVSSFASVETPDAQTVVVTLAAPSAGFPWLLQGCLSGVASPTALQQFGATYGTSPETTVGAGAFLVSEYLPGDRITYKRNPDFWDSPRPYLDEMTLRAPATQSQALDAVLSGTADVAILQNGALGTDYARFLDSDDIQHETYGPLSGAIAYGFNTTRAPLDDVRVRRALVMAFDPEGFNAKVAGGKLEMADTFLSEESAFYDASVKQPSGQLAEAQKLIDEYVAEKGPVNITILNSSSTAAWNTAVQQDWSKLKGVTVEITADTDQSAVPKLISGDYMTAAFQLGTDIDPETLFGRYHSSSSLNVLKFSDPKMDEWVSEYRDEEDPAKQQELVSEITRFLVMDQHWIMHTYRVQAYAGARPSVHGVTWTSPRDINPAELWLES